MTETPDFKGPKIVVIGGGTGSFTLLSGLKHYARHITALVNMADDGGSTGVLRDELGALPPGDVRQCLVALSGSPKVRDLFDYRFEEGSLKGHAFGNLFLSALEKISGNFAEAVELAIEILNVSGRVEPVTLSNVRLCMQSKDEPTVKGQFRIGQTDFKSSRPELWLEPEAELNPRAAEAIAEADMVVIAPGNLYGSLAPALLVPGIGEAIKQSKAKKVYICNLVTKPGQTDGFKVHDFAAEIERFMGGAYLNAVVYNTVTPAKTLFETYAKAGEHLVQVDGAGLEKAHYQAVPAAVLARQPWQGASTSDPIASARTFIRHDSDKLARQLMKLYFD